MSLFPQTIAAHLGGRTVRVSFLVLFDFVTQPMRIWTGSGSITAGGQEWFGIGQLGSISGLEQAVNGEAPETTFVLSGINPQVVSIARDEFETEARDRLCKVLLQFHNDDDDRPLEMFDAPYAIWAGRMQTAQFEMQGPNARRINVTAESLFSLRSRPNFSQYTNSDQSKRFDGDKGFEFVATLINKVVTWPDFLSELVLRETVRKWASTPCDQYPCGLEVWAFVNEVSGRPADALPPHQTRRQMVDLLKQMGGLEEYARSLMLGIGWTEIADEPRRGDVGVVDFPAMGLTCAISLGGRWMAKGMGHVLISRRAA